MNQWFWNLSKLSVFFCKFFQTSQVYTMHVILIRYYRYLPFHTDLCKWILIKSAVRNLFSLRPSLSCEFFLEYIHPNSFLLTTVHFHHPQIQTGRHSCWSDLCPCNSWLSLAPVCNKMFIYRMFRALISESILLWSKARIT